VSVKIGFSPDIPSFGRDVTRHKPTPSKNPKIAIACSGKDDSLVAVEEHTPFSIPLNGSSKHLALNIGTLVDELLGAHAVVDAGNTLLDYRALIQIGCDKMRRGANDLDAALVGLVVGLRALERGQEAVVNIDDAARHSLTEHRAEHLHVACQHNELNVVFLDQLQHLRLLLCLGLLGNRQVMELDAVASSQRREVGMVGHDQRNLYGQLARLRAKQQVVETMADLGHHDEHPSLARHRSDVPRHGVLGRQRVEGRLEMFRRRRWCRPKVHPHKEALACRVRELLQVQDVVPLAGKHSRDRVHNARLVGARQRQDVVPVVSHC